jgi:hypothetical protein
LYANQHRRRHRTITAATSPPPCPTTAATSLPLSPSPYLHRHRPSSIANHPTTAATIQPLTALTLQPPPSPAVVLGMLDHNAPDCTRSCRTHASVSSLNAVSSVPRRLDVHQPPAGRFDTSGSRVSLSLIQLSAPPPPPCHHHHQPLSTAIIAIRRPRS